MSAGLMSCVRENSPPLEMDDTGAVSLPPPDTPETQKRRRFHPLRNLRRIFRRRTVTQADLSPNSQQQQQLQQQQQQQHQGDQLEHQQPIANIDSVGNDQIIIRNNNNNSNNIDGGIVLSGSTSDGGCGFRRESRDRSVDSLRNQSNNKCDLVDREMNDYQRSLSEGRLINSEFSRDGLSQSHDSVFSESATASSLSIVLRAELTDALRKRRDLRDASDEDLGLPGSPITPLGKQRVINQSEGSLSLLSIVSSDMDEDVSSSGGATGIGSNLPTSSSSSSALQQHQYKSLMDEVDLISSFTSSSKLSHSAAKHKMAVRPKKKGPTRHRRHIDSVLPTTFEVNEEILRMNSNDINASSLKRKSQSLPPGMNVKMMEKHGNMQDSSLKTTSTSTMFTSKTIENSAFSTSSILSSVTTSSTTTITSKMYGNKNTSKSYDKELSSINNAASTVTNSTITTNDSNTISSSNPSTLDRNDEGGFFRRLLHRSSNRKKKQFDEKDVIDTAGIVNDDSISKQTENPSVPQLTSTITTASTTTEPIKNTTTRTSTTSSVNIVNKPSIIIETKPYESSAFALNTYLSTSPPTTVSNDQSKNVPKNNNEKPRSGPASRQRILPKELTISPKIDNRKFENEIPLTTTGETLLANATEDFLDNEKLPPKSPRKLTASIDYGKQRFGGGSSTGGVGGAINFQQSLSKPPLNDNSKFSKQKSDEILIPAAATITTTQKTMSINNKTEPIFQSISPPKICGLSPFQQKITRNYVDVQRASSRPVGIKNTIDTTGNGGGGGGGGDDVINIMDSNEKLYTKRKSVEKSKSFRFYSENSQSDNLQNSLNMPSLPDLTISERKIIDSTGDFSQNPISGTGNTSSGSEFEINDLNLIRQPKYTKTDDSTKSINNNKQKLSNTQNLLVKNKILTTTPSATTIKSTGATNITQIEDNIDKIMKSSFVSVLRKSTSIPSDNSPGTGGGGGGGGGAGAGAGAGAGFPSDFTNSSEILRSKNQYNISNNNNSNVSVTAIKNSLTDEQLTSTNESKESIKLQRNISMFETTAQSMNNQKIPEFMKVQLNRIDSSSGGRPKSQIIYSRIDDEQNGNNGQFGENYDDGDGDDDGDDDEIHEQRRFSNENVEITDSIKPSQPPSHRPISTISYPSVSQQDSTTRNNLTKSAENLFELPKFINKKIISSTSSMDKTSSIRTSSISMSDITKEFIRSSTVIDQNNNKIFSNFNNNRNIISNSSVEQRKKSSALLINSERFIRNDKKSVLDERKKIDDKQHTINNNNNNNNQIILNGKSPTDDENTVVLRKKSLVQSNSNTSSNGGGGGGTGGKDEPELMKVFARRSLKIKDSDEFQIYPDEVITTTSNTTSSSSSSTTTTTTTSTTINQLKNGKIGNLDSDKENQSSSEEKLDKLPKIELTIQTNNKINNQHFNKDERILKKDIIHQNNGSTTSTNSTIAPASVTVSATTDTNLRKNILITPKPFVPGTNRNYSNVKPFSDFRKTLQNEMKIPSATSAISSTIGKPHQSPSIPSESNNNNNNIRHTINTVNTIVDNDSEFKGIVQRRAEWEKRAKEAFK